MRMVVTGGGPLGPKLVTRLRQDGHEAIPASPDTSARPSPAIGRIPAGTTVG